MTSTTMNGAASTQVTRADDYSGSGAAVAGRMKWPEFILLISALFSLIALSVDMMLPALPRIEADLPGAVTESGARLGDYVVYAFVLGMAATPIFYGVGADAYGRRAPLLASLVIFTLGGAICILAQDFETLLAGRFIQGAGVVGTRIIVTAVVRDLFSGRRMARVMSIVLIIFIGVPALAPAFGLGVEVLTGWRGLFGVLSMLGAVLMIWVLLRLPDTLRQSDRRPVRRAELWDGLRKVFTRRPAIGAIAAAAVFFSGFLAYLGTAHLVFGEIYGFGDDFVYVFAAIALCIGLSSVVNARMVERWGVQRMMSTALMGQMLVSGLATALFWFWDAAPPFALYVSWCAAMAFFFGLAFANMNALAMHFLGDVAGLGAAVLTTAQNLISAIGAAWISSMILADPTPLAKAALVCAAASYVILLLTWRSVADRDAP